MTALGQERRKQSGPGSDECPVYPGSSRKITPLVCAAKARSELGFAVS